MVGQRRWEHAAAAPNRSRVRRRCYQCRQLEMVACLPRGVVSRACRGHTATLARLLGRGLGLGGGGWGTTQEHLLLLTRWSLCLISQGPLWNLGKLISTTLLYMDIAMTFSPHSRNKYLMSVFRAKVGLPRSNGRLFLRDDLHSSFAYMYVEQQQHNARSRGST